MGERASVGVRATPYPVHDRTCALTSGPSRCHERDRDGWSGGAHVRLGSSTRDHDGGNRLFAALSSSEVEAVLRRNALAFYGEQRL